MKSNWEYITARFDVKNGVFSGPQIDEQLVKSKLNDLGAQGWELVSMTPIKESSGHSTACILATLKRSQLGT